MAIIAALEGKPGMEWKDDMELKLTEHRGIAHSQCDGVVYGMGK